MSKPLQIIAIFYVFTTCHAKYYATTCELMRDIVNVSDASPLEAAKWSCVGRLSTHYNDNSFLGVFQIGREWWCSNDGGGICNVNCSALIDDDITDDFRCAKRILSGYGESFETPWPGSEYCLKNQLNERLNDCPMERRRSSHNKHRNNSYNGGSSGETHEFSDENPPEVPED